MEEPGHTTDGTPDDVHKRRSLRRPCGRGLAHRRRRGTPENGHQLRQQGQRAARQEQHPEEVRHNNSQWQGEKGSGLQLQSRARSGTAISQKSGRRYRQQALARCQSQLRHQFRPGREQPLLAANPESAEDQRAYSAAEGRGGHSGQKAPEQQGQQQQQHQQQPHRQLGQQ